MKVNFFSIVTMLAMFVTSQLAMAQGANAFVEIDNNGNLLVEGADNVDEFIYVEATTTANQFVFFDPVGNTADFNAKTVINTGSGNDAVLFDEADFFGDFSAKMGSGNDLTLIINWNQA